MSNSLSSKSICFATIFGCTAAFFFSPAVVGKEVNAVVDQQKKCELRQEKQLDELRKSALELIKGEHLNEARNKIDQALKLSPSDWAAHYLLGMVYRNRHDPKKALEEFSFAAKQVDRVDIQMDRALAFQKLGRNAEAMLAAALAYNLSHDDERVHRFVLDVTALAEQDPTILRQFNELLKRDPKNFALHKGLANMLFDRRPMEALQEVDYVLGFAQSSILWEIRAKKMLRLQRYREAVHDCNMAFACKENCTKRLGILYYIRSSAYGKLGEWSKALEDVNRELKLYPHQVNLYYDRAKLYHHLHETAKGIADCDRIIATQKTHLVEAYALRGAMKAEQNNYQAALDDYNKALSVGPECKEALAGRAEVLDILGKHEQAAKDRRTLKEIDTDF